MGHRWTLRPDCIEGLDVVQGEAEAVEGLARAGEREVSRERRQIKKKSWAFFLFCSSVRERTLGGWMWNGIRCWVISAPWSRPLILDSM